MAPGNRIRQQVRRSGPRPRAAGTLACAVLLWGALTLGATARDAPKPPPSPKPPGFAGVLAQTLAGRQFVALDAKAEPAAGAAFDRLKRGDYAVPAMSPVAESAGLDRIVAQACPALPSPSRVIKDETPFLLTGQENAKTVPPGASISVGNIQSADLTLSSGHFIVFAQTVTGARIAPAPIVVVRSLELPSCEVSGNALSLVDGTVTDGTIIGQGLVVAGGEPLWIVAGQSGPRVALSLHPLDARPKGYKAENGWKFLSTP